MTTEEASFVDSILADKAYYMKWLDGKSRLNGGIYSKDNIAEIVSYIKDKYGNYYVLVEGKLIPERRFDTHLRVRFVKSMGNARPNNPKQRSHQGELPFSIIDYPNVSEDCLNNETHLKFYLNLVENLCAQSEDEQREYVEGRKNEYNILRLSRNRAVRNQCLEKSKGKCYVCDFDFSQVYGEIGKGFLEVHHRIPISHYNSEHRVKIKDLCAVCPNCHRIIHHTKDPIDVDILKSIVKGNKNKEN